MMVFIPLPRLKRVRLKSNKEEKDDLWSVKLYSVTTQENGAHLHGHRRLTTESNNKYTWQ